MRLGKKMYRVILAVCLAAAALQNGAVISPAAAAPTEPVQLSIGDVTLLKGGTTAVPVSIQTGADGGVASYNMQLDFDPNEIQVVQVTPKYGSNDEVACTSAAEGCFQANFDNNAGWVRAIWLDASAGKADTDGRIAGSKPLFEITLKAATGSSSGLKHFTIDKDNPEKLTFTGYDHLHPLPVTIAGGNLNLVLLNSSSTPAAPAERASAEQPSYVKVIVDGKEQNTMATAVTEKAGQRTVTKVIVDNDKAIEQVNQGELKTLVVPVKGTGSDDIVGELNGKLVKTMEGKDAVVEVQTDRATYILPASQIQIDSVSAALGSNIALEDIKISVRISETSGDKVEAAQTYATNGNMELVVKPVDFEVVASYGDSKVEIKQFNSYVERTITLPDNVDPSRLTTGVVVGADGQLTHLPTRITMRDGIYYADIQSLTNSSYTVIWNPKTFDDVKQHWSREDVNDLASRLIIEGSADGRFLPDKTITRAEFTAILLRALGLRTPKAGTPAVSFADVAQINWYAAPIAAAVSYGLISGYEDGTFRPEGTITRAEAMVMLARAMDIVKLDKVSDSTKVSRLLAGFTDNEAIGVWAQPAAASAVQQGIVDGVDGKLLPKEAISRAQTAAMVRRLLIRAKLINP
ncbi:S-layer homology domain-containing protein [Paenibacillus thalictri]|nr:S-layer homology domain-containing protein [Paenibacillus thalictri]